MLFSSASSEESEPPKPSLFPSALLMMPEMVGAWLACLVMADMEVLPTGFSVIKRPLPDVCNEEADNPPSAIWLP
jgi:hypothetical protein